ncbi:LysR family transcriptional regulator [Photobacterium kagoshimensis]|uniref:LysR family transcriptional regulator n=1 Tax=Photobacterium kagoshimensis TaxID=2910242 RepID=UPI003D132E14
MINPTWVNTFITLVNTGHFTQTAEKLFMTQPGVSQHIKKLEEQVGSELLVRFGKRFELTESGQKMYKFGLQQQQQENQFLASLSVDDVNCGVCKIGCSGSLAMQLYPRLLQRQQKYKQLSFHVEAGPNQSTIKNILNDDLDVGIVTQTDSNSNLIFEEIGHSSLSLVMPAQFIAQYAEKMGSNVSEALRFKALNELGFIHHPDGAHYASQVLTANYPESFKNISQLNITGYINQLSQILVPVSQGLGYTVLPESAVESFHQPQLLHVYPLKYQVSEALYLVKKRHRPLPRRYDWLITMLRATLTPS